MEGIRINFFKKFLKKFKQNFYLIENNWLVDISSLLNEDFVSLRNNISRRGLDEQALLGNHIRRDNELLGAIWLDHYLMRGSYIFSLQQWKVICSYRKHRSS